MLGSLANGRLALDQSKVTVGREGRDLKVEGKQLGRHSWLWLVWGWAMSIDCWSHASAHVIGHSKCAKLYLHVLILTILNISKQCYQEEQLINTGWMLLETDLFEIVVFAFDSSLPKSLWGVPSELFLEYFIDCDTHFETSALVLDFSLEHLTASVFISASYILLERRTYAP